MNTSNVHSRGMLLSPVGGLCTTGLQERLVNTMAATISSISTAASAFLQREGRDVKLAWGESRERARV